MAELDYLKMSGETAKHLKVGIVRSISLLIPALLGSLGPVYIFWKIFQLSLEEHWNLYMFGILLIPSMIALLLSYIPQTNLYSKQ